MNWNTKEIDFLNKNYPYIDDEILIKRLNRSIPAIRRKANKDLRLRKVKICKLCGENITFLNRNAIVCKSCFKSYNKIYKQKWCIKNKEKLKEKGRLWRLINKEHKREIDKLWRLKNRERKKANYKAYYQKIKELRPNPICVDCGIILIRKNNHTKRCNKCGKKYKYMYDKEYRKRHIERFRELDRKYNKKAREKENQRRKELGLPLIGNYFRKEQELLFYIKRLFPHEKVIYHDRSVLGNGWELDIFIPSLNLAFEYHGRQHFDFKSTGYWETYEEFEAQQLRDDLKRILCSIKDITLIEFTCYEKLSEQLVLNKLFKYNINTNQLNLIVFNQKTK